MRLAYLPSSVLPTIALVVTVGVAVPQQVFAASAKEVARVAVPTTVRIDNPLGVELGGSGVIVAKDGNTYTVLTCNHVVQNPNLDYTIYTSKKKTYKVKEIINLQKTPSDPDLAIVRFESAEEQAVAPIANSDEAEIGSGIYISGFPMSPDVKGVREYEFTNGQVSSRRDGVPGGYNMRYTAVTRRGMSGGPVFDVSGRVVGVHGQGDREGVVKNEAGSGAGTIDLKTGLNAAIPINTFVGIAPQAKVEKTALAIDTAKVADAPATRVSKQEVRSWEEEFALNVGIGLVLRGLNVPASIPIPGFGGFRF